MPDPGQTAYEARFAGEASLNRALDAAYHEARSLAEQAGVSWKDAKRVADVYYGPAIKNDAEKIAAAEAEVAKLTRERDEARADQKDAEDSNDALNVKLHALAPHGSCACSYDKPGDVCLHHSPALVAAEATVSALRDRVAVLEEALGQIAAHPRDYDDGRQSFGIGYAFGNIKNIARAALTQGAENAKS